MTMAIANEHPYLIGHQDPYIPGQISDRFPTRLHIQGQGHMIRQMAALMEQGISELPVRRGPAYHHDGFPSPVVGISQPHVQLAGTYVAIGLPYLAFRATDPPQ